jgi:hypothetical protein
MSKASRVWQVAGGTTNRPYADVFLRYGVALIGPGEGGAWLPNRRAPDSIGFLRRFAEEMKLGDLVLLRMGSDTVVAVGIVAGDYAYLESFDDVRGWDLCHGRRVRWGLLSEPYGFDRAVFGSSPPRVSRVRNAEAMDFAQRFVASGLTHWKSAPLPELPPVEPSLNDVPESLRDVVGLAQDLAGLYADPERVGDPPAENEMVAHLVVPFLRALGWKPERIAVEWRRIDVALFDDLPRTPERCRIVIEAKRLGSGLEGARRQAKEYVDRLGVTRDVVVTDGLRYRAFDCENDFEPIAYANLAKLKESATELFAWLHNDNG